MQVDGFNSHLPPLRPKHLQYGSHPSQTTPDKNELHRVQRLQISQHVASVVSGKMVTIKIIVVVANMKTAISFDIVDLKN